jgi:exodeoxyribonuclease VII large subunit
MRESGETLDIVGSGKAVLYGIEFAVTPMPSPDSVPRTVYAVSELTELLRTLLEDSLPSLWVEGEISNFARPASGHWYFTLKDARAQIRCAMFRNANYLVRPPPKDGDAVLLRGRAGVYPARGELQLIVEYMEPAGTGALLRAFEELKNRLALEGLFDVALKRPLPKVPRRIGLITSATGAAVHDVLTALERRWPLAQVCLYPVPVQGKEAPPAIAAALADLPRRMHVDLILLVRGGGSLEDLWAFNDERVARAIRACAAPVVCGVGHEVDVTIADFAADLRAATPTAAAELATPDIAVWLRQLEQLQQRSAELLRRTLQARTHALQTLQGRLQRQSPQRRLQDRAQRLDELALRMQAAQRALLRDRRLRLAHADARLLAARPLARVQAARTECERLDQRLQRAALAALQRNSERLQRSERLLASLNPRAVLERGYAIARDAEGRILRNATATAPGAALDITLARGRIRADVTDIESD